MHTELTSRAHITEEDYRDVWKLKVLSSFISLGWGTMGYTYAIYNPTFSPISYTLGWEKEEIPFDQGLGVAMLPLGAFISIALIIWKFYYSSRRNLLVLADFLTIIGSLLDTFTNFGIFLGGRFLIGIAIGINGLIGVLFVIETVPIILRAKFTSYDSVMATLGKFVAFLLAFLIPYPPTRDGFWWRVLYLLPLFASILRLVYLLLIYRFDTPKYYLLKAREQQTWDLLDRTHPEELIPQVMDGITAETQIEKNLSFKKLIKDYRMQFIAATILVCLRQVTGYFTLLSYSTSILTGSPVYLYLDQNENYENSVVNLMMGSIFVLIGFIISFSSGDQEYKKPMIIGTTIQTVGLIGTGIALELDFRLAADGLLLLTILGLSLGLGTCALMYCLEILPMKGFAYILLIDNLANFLFNLSFLPLANVDEIDFQGLLYAMGAIAMLGIFAITALVVDTKELSNKQIYERYMGLKLSGIGKIEKHDEEQDSILGSPKI